MQILPISVFLEPTSPNTTQCHPAQCHTATLHCHCHCHTTAIATATPLPLPLPLPLDHTPHCHWTTQLLAPLPLQPPHTTHNYRCSCSGKRHCSSRCSCCQSHKAFEGSESCASGHKCKLRRGRLRGDHGSRLRMPSCTRTATIVCGTSASQRAKNKSDF